MVGMADTLAFTKGHGTENDFVLVPDPDGVHDLLPTQVAALADRRAGIGGDGVIRVVPTRAATDAGIREQAGEAEWFMDYRNADGSEAEMCGNGTRVFAAYLRREGLVEGDEFSIATRGGVKRVRFEGDLIAVNLGAWRLVDPAKGGAEGFDSLVHVPGLEPLSALSLDLSRPPAVNPVPPHGTNVEFVRPEGPGHLTMRVHERGVGETRSCGTGACAAALATRYWAGDGAPDEWLVDVPGGRLRVRALPGSEVELAGPAALVADGVTTLV